MGSGRLKSHLFQIIHSLVSEHSITLLLKVAKLTRSSYYKWRKGSKNSRSSSDKKLKEQIRQIHSRYTIYGYRRITTALHKMGQRVNHKRVYRLMRELGLRSIIRKKRKYFGRRGSLVFPNIFQRDFVSNKRHHKLATDITYLPTKTGFLYLSAIQDLHNNEIISYRLSKRNNLDLVIKTIEQLELSPQNQTILHSDQGFQYTSKYYKQVLDKAGIQGSHSRRGNCLDNACIESFFSHLKTEGLPEKTLLSEQEMICKIHSYIDFYNHERFQKRLGQLSPVEFREKLAA
jgi:transposase InsO family protein